MGEQAQELSGPDLAAGVALSEVAEGGMLAGHAAGEAVLLVRTGGGLYAVDAACTHYGVPLEGGIVTGSLVRCPAHHSVFDVRTGEAVAAPALRPLGCWNVEVRDGRAFVTGKREAAAPAPAPLPAGAPQSVVIVGAGAAGSACAQMLRREGYAGRITMVDAGGDAPYDRPNLSKDYLAGNAPEEWIPLWPAEWYEQNGVDLLLSSRAARIDVAEKKLRMMNGRALDYDALLLATGSDPVRLPIATHALPHVHYLRTLADSRAIIRAAEHATSVVVVGSSFIGLEVASALRARGLAVELVSHEELPLARVAGPEVGAYIQRVHQEHGVRFHLRDGVAAIDQKSVTTKSGRTLPADLVVVGIGVRPGLALAQWAGLQVEGGVVVDKYLQTSAPGIYAAGDVCRWPDPWTGQRIRSEHWVVAQRQGQAAARNMLGRRIPFRAAPFFWSTQYDLTLTYVGHAEKWDAVEIDGSLEARDATVTYRHAGKPLAVLNLAREKVSLAAEAGMEADDLAAVEAAISPHPAPALV